MMCISVCKREIKYTLKMFIEIPKSVTQITSTVTYRVTVWMKTNLPYSLRLLTFFLPSSHPLISGLLLCLPICFFLIPSPSHIHLPSLPILWFSAWLPSRLKQDGLSPEPPHIQHQCILLKMPTNVTFYLFLLLVYLSYAYITASPQEHWKVVPEKWELSTVCYNISGHPAS